MGEPIFSCKLEKQKVPHTYIEGILDRASTYSISGNYWALPFTTHNMYTHKYLCGDLYHMGT